MRDYEGKCQTDNTISNASCPNTLHEDQSLNNVTEPIKIIFLFYLIIDKELTIAKAVKGTQIMINHKKDLVKGLRNIQNDWGPKPKEDLPNRTVEALVNSLEHDIEFLETLKQEIKPSKSTKNQKK